MNKFLDFSDLFDFNDSVNNFFYDLRYLHNLFYNSGNNYNFFYDLFNFNYFGHFNHLFKDFVDSNSNFLNSLDCPWYLHNLFNNYFDWIVLSDEVVDWFFNFNDLVDLNYLIYISDHLNDFRNLNSLYYNLSDDFGYPDNFLLHNGYFNSSIHNLFYLLYHRHWMVYNSLYFFYSVSVNDLLFNNFNFLNCWDFNLHLNDLLYSFGYFNNFLNSLDDRNWLLNNNFDDFRHIHNLVDSFYGTSPLNDFNRLFNYTVKRLDNLHYLFYYFLFDNFNFDHFSDDSLDSHNLFFDYLNFSDLRNGVVDNLLNNHRLLDFNNLFPDHLDFN